MSVDSAAPTASLSTPSAFADDLTATNVPDTSLNEQTWPTEEEMGESATGAGTNGTGAGTEAKRRTKRVPKGTSAYQAAWIFDDEDEEGEDDDDEDDGDGMDEDGDSGANEDGEEVPSLVDNEDDEEEEETEEVELDDRGRAGHRDLDPEEEEAESVFSQPIPLDARPC